MSRKYKSSLKEKLTVRFELGPFWFQGTWLNASVPLTKLKELNRVTEGQIKPINLWGGG